jgi:hypothetical protein
MLTFSETALLQVRRQLDAVSPETRAELTAADLIPLESRCERLRRRGQLWHQRARELIARGPDGRAAVEGGG